MILLHAQILCGVRPSHSGRIRKNKSKEMNFGGAVEKATMTDSSPSLISSSQLSLLTSLHSSLSSPISTKNLSTILHHRQ
jgi:hypothetical protein